MSKEQIKSKNTTKNIIYSHGASRRTSIPFLSKRQKEYICGILTETDIQICQASL